MINSLGIKSNQLMKGFIMADITKLTIKQDTIKLLTQYEKDDINQKIGTNKVAINIKNAINKDFFELPNLVKAKPSKINEVCSEFATEVLELVWKDVPASQKYCLRVAMPMAVAGVKYKLFSPENNKDLSRDNNIWTDGNRVPENLNKDGGSKVALSMKDFSSLARKKLELVESKNKQTPIEATSNRLTNLLQEVDSKELKDGSTKLKIQEKEVRALRLTQKEINKIFEMLNDEKAINKDIKEVVNQ
mgnify:CR=1 FL=1